MKTESTGTRVEGLYGRVAFWAILAVAFAFRLYALGRLPGVNGDEAWYGVLAERLGHANPHGWRTPSGNPPAPFQLGLLALLVRIAPPSFALLRLPAVLASLAQTILTFFVARRHLGRGPALVAVLLTAALPAEIVYARFGWDPSHAGLVAVAACHFALAGRIPALVALFALAVWVHPTNVFLAPFLAAILLFRHPDRRLALRRVALFLSVFAVGLAIVAIAARGSAGAVRAGAVASRLVRPSAWWEFALLFVRLVDGDTVFAFITGEGYGPARPAVDAAVAVLMGAAAIAGGRRIGGDPARLGIVVGWVASVAGFFVFAGPDALRPHFERYGICLMVPTILALAVLGTSAWRESRATLTVGLLCVAALLAFWRCYFVALETTGSTSHETFWTGAVEPKREAFRRIEAEARSSGGALVVARSWWLYWPLAYLSGGGTSGSADGAIEVTDREPAHARSASTYFVDFPGGPTAREAAAASASLHWQIQGARERVVLEVWKLVSGDR